MGCCGSKPKSTMYEAAEAAARPSTRRDTLRSVVEVPPALYYNRKTGSEHILDIPKPTYYNPRTGSEHSNEWSMYGKIDLREKASLRY